MWAPPVAVCLSSVLVRSSPFLRPARCNCTILPRHADLGCDLYLVAWGPLGEYLADDLLRTARAVDGCVSIGVMPRPRPIVWSRWIELRQWRPTSNHRLSIYRGQFVRSADPSYQLQSFPCVTLTTSRRRRCPRPLLEAGRSPTSRVPHRHERAD
jgi:hypothetical protein